MKDIYTNYSPAFFSFVESIAEEKGIKLLNICGSDSNWMNFFRKSSQSNLYVISAIREENIAYGGKVTQGEFLDTLAAFKPAPKPVTLKTKVIGYQPVITGEVVKIGCQEFTLDEIKQFQKEYEEWEKSGEIEISECYTDSSTELRAYVKSICPKCIRNCIENVGMSYPYLVLLNYDPGMAVTGEHSGEGEKVSASQFIARLEEAKVVRKEKKGIINTSEYPIAYIFTDGPQDIFFLSHGSISHGKLKEFFAEVENLKEIP